MTKLGISELRNPEPIDKNWYMITPYVKIHYQLCGVFRQYCEMYTWHTFHILQAIGLA